MAIRRTMRNAGGRAALAAGVLAAAVLLAVLAGCGVIGEKYTVIEWYASYFEKYYPAWFEEFEKTHADRNVRIRFRAMVGGIEQMIYTMLLSHTLCDCIGLGPQSSALLLENPVLEPLTQGDVDSDDVPPLSIRLASQPDGTLVAYPQQLNIRPFIYYNRALFGEAGTNAGEVPDTFNDYRRWASRLFKWRLDSQIALGPLEGEELERASMLRRPIGMIRGFTWSAIPLLSSYMEPLPDDDGVSDWSADDFFGGPPAGRPFRFDTPEFIRGLEFYKSFYMPKKTAIADGDMNRLVGFKEGVYGGAEGSNWIYGEVFTIDMQITKLPRPEGRERRVWMTSSAIGVSRESRHKELAKEFAAFITRPQAQVDAYYGHGYLPASFTAWRQLNENDRVDTAVREKFLDALGRDSGPYVGIPRIKRENHDTMDVYLYVPRARDERVLIASYGGESAVEVTEDIAGVATSYRAVAEKLAPEIAAFAGLGVNVIVQGTPEDMIPARSYVTASPVPVYAGVLKNGIYVPVGKIWNRLQGEVITRVCQFVTRAQDPMPVEEAALWAQREAEDIVAGRK